MQQMIDWIIKDYTRNWYHKLYLRPASLLAIECLDSARGMEMPNHAMAKTETDATRHIHISKRYPGICTDECKGPAEPTSHTDVSQAFGPCVAMPNPVPLGDLSVGILPQRLSRHPATSYIVHKPQKRTQDQSRYCGNQGRIIGRHGHGGTCQACFVRNGQCTGECLRFFGLVACALAYALTLPVDEWFALTWGKCL
ncbi:hypothetical protein BJ138DRAFT_1142309 [Hygrophoropsis aurantiaca]|uniref:Uncharacterized protein n=1 Tax=Hygrophoropsis aurantiaca TaxID=72124 RepID=A0ACB8APS8_9AGAM|nr:hypothetical protein BJ138DRAFT_1142309 [Hygrophoropsis aurantiaca]